MKRRALKFKDVENDVRPMLEHYPLTRDSDITLWLMIAEKRHKGITKLSAAELMLRLVELDIPTIESVGRVRRKIQSKDESLRGTQSITDMRYENWKEYTDYAKG